MLLLLLLLTFPDVLPDDGDVVVPVVSRVLVVEAQGVHRLVQGPADVAQAVAGLGVWGTEGKVLAATATANVRPTPAKKPTFLMEF